MAIKQKPIYVCDYCVTEIKGKPGIITEDVPNEGCSSICTETKTFDVSEGHYCDLECFVAQLKEKLS